MFDSLLTELWGEIGTIVAAACLITSVRRQTIAVCDLHAKKDSKCKKSLNS